MWIVIFCNNAIFHNVIFYTMIFTRWFLQCVLQGDFYNAIFYNVVLYNAICKNIIFTRCFTRWFLQYDFLQCEFLQCVFFTMFEFVSLWFKFQILWSTKINWIHSLCYYLICSPLANLEKTHGSSPIAKRGGRVFPWPWAPSQQPWTIKHA